jgi:hypothetical protein
MMNLRAKYFFRRLWIVILILCLCIACKTKEKAKYANIGSVSELRLLLASEIPIGINVAEVENYFGMSNFPNMSESDATCGFSEYDEIKRAISFYTCEGIFSGFWAIRLMFDENEILKEYEINRYP